MKFQSDSPLKYLSLETQEERGKALQQALWPVILGDSNAGHFLTIS